MCKAIENSSEEAKAQYLMGMKKAMPHKIQLILPWINRVDSVLDLGCADGNFSFELDLHTDNVIGIDSSEEVLKIAREQCPHIEFKQGLAEHFTLEKPVDVVVCSSLLHEVYSYSKELDGFRSLEHTLNNIRKNLKDGGKLIIRDFVSPEPNLTVDFEHFKSDIVKGHSYTDFHTQRKTDSAYSWKFMAGTDDAETFTYRGQKIQDVYEYIFHKDYHTNWETEIKETYGFWTGTQAKALLKLLGYEIEHYAELDNQWITNNRLEGKVKIMDGNIQVPFPKYQCLIVAHKA
jgi:SAM-dependent methyltransferase